VVCDDTDLAGSRLQVDYRPVTLRCQCFDTETIVSSDLLLLRQACGSDDVRVTGGEELLVTSLDLAEA